MSVSQCTIKSINLSSTDKWTLTLRDNLNTLSCRVCSLVKLTWKSFNCKYICIRNIHTIRNIIELWL